MKVQAIDEAREISTALAGFAYLGSPDSAEAERLAVQVLTNAPEAARAHRCGVCLGYLEGEPDPGLPLCAGCGRKLHELVRTLTAAIAALMPTRGIN